MTVPTSSTLGYVPPPGDGVSEGGLAAIAGAPAGNFDIGLAIALMRQGSRVARRGWNGKGMWLALQVPDAGSKMTLPYIYMSTAQGGLVPWLASQTDILADDWVLV